MRFARPAPRVRRGPLITGIVLACLVIAGLVGWRFLMSGGSIDTRFTTGQPVVVPLTAQEYTMVWVRTAGPATPDPACHPAQRPKPQPAAGLTTKVMLDDVRLDADGGTWRGALLLQAYPAGDYALTCTAGDLSMDLAVGRPPRWYATEHAKPIAYLAQIVLWGAVLLIVLIVVRLVVAGVRRARAGSR